MSHFVAYILQFQEIIVYKIPPGGGRGSIASLRSIWAKRKGLSAVIKILSPMDCLPLPGAIYIW